MADQAGHTVEECARTYTHLFDEHRDAEPERPEELIARARTEVARKRRAV